MNEPAGGFIYDQEGGMVEEDGGFHDQNFEERSETSKRGRIKIRIKMSMKMRTSVGDKAVPVL